MKRKKISIYYLSLIIALVVAECAASPGSPQPAKYFLILDYPDFGPQVIAHEIIGFQWFQWQSEGGPDPNKKYPIKVVVYRDKTLEEVKNQFPIHKKQEKDYRYIEYDKALEFLDQHIKEFEEGLKSDTEDASIYKGLLSLFRMTKKKIIDYFQEERP